MRSLNYTLERALDPKAAPRNCPRWQCGVESGIRMEEPPFPKPLLAVAVAEPTFSTKSFVATLGLSS